jgi:hypothetical protein
MSKGTALLVAGATATTVVTGGWVAGRVTTDQPLLPTAAESPASSPSADPAPQEVEFQSMRIDVPADWRVQRVEEDFATPGQPDPAPGEWIALFPDGGTCGVDLTWTVPGGETCRHLKILGPLGIERGGPGNGPLDAETYYVPTTEVPPCPEGADITPDNRSRPPAGEVEDVEIGGRAATRGEWHVPCLTGPDFQDYATYPQVLWRLPAEEILIVDNFGFDGLEEILGTAEFS